jgi:U3 small nucleolar RNA-associated protein 4
MIVSPPYFPSLPSTSKIDLLPAQLAQQHQVPILTSGGLDLSLIIVSVASASFLDQNKTRELSNPVSDTPPIEYETTIHRRCAYIPQRSHPLTLAAAGRLLVCRRERSVGIWTLDELSKSSLSGSKVSTGRRDFADDNGETGEDQDDENEEKDGWRKVLEMDLKVSTLSLHVPVL